MNRIALITGASCGLGRELAEFLAKQDYDLILTARGSETLENVARSVARHGVRVESIAGDVSDEGHRQRLTDAIKSFGRLDVLVNNASDLGLSPLPPLSKYPLDEIKRVFEVNFFAPIGLIQSTLPVFTENGGLIINISSDAALGGYPGWGAYGSSKAAIDLASLTFANELVDAGIAVVSVDPGDMRTQMHQSAFPDEDISDRPLPEATIPFWAWLFGQNRSLVNGRRFKAQSDRWEVAA